MFTEYGLDLYQKVAGLFSINQVKGIVQRSRKFSDSIDYGYVYCLYVTNVTNDT